MKQILQLRIGQHLTMTPQLQQAIRLLQLSTVELQSEVQEQLDSNLMLEVAEDEAPGPVPLSEAEVEPTDIPKELEVDTAWEDVYDNTPVTNFSAGDGMPVVDYESQRSATESLSDHLRWQLSLTNFTEIDALIAEHIVDAIGDEGRLTIPLEEICDLVNLNDLDLEIEVDEIEVDEIEVDEIEVDEIEVDEIAPDSKLRSIRGGRSRCTRESADTAETAPSRYPVARRGHSSGE